MLGKLNHQEIDNLLRTEIVGRIGCHADDTTYIVPISYAFDKDIISDVPFPGILIRFRITRKTGRFEKSRQENFFAT